MKNELIAAMNAAHEAGLSVFPLGANKRPAVREWRPYMEHQPGLDELKIWQASDYCGYAVVMGGPERLLAIDLEAAFVQCHMTELAARLRDVELEATFTTWLDGYGTKTPSGGFHIVIHLMGNEPMPGPEKLAWADGKVTAETRGQGSYIAGYGSNGNCHPNGGQWVLAYGGYDRVAWAEPEEWAGVRAVLISFDEAPLAPADHRAPPAAVTKSSAGGVSLAQIEHSTSWIDATERPPLAEVLRELGWWSPDGVWWWRPGKDHREQHSARINENGRLYVWTTSTPIPSSDSMGGRTYDVVDVIAFYEGVDRMTVLRRWKPTSSGREVPAQPSSELVLPTEFWSATQILAHIRQAAWSRRISPDTLFEAVKSLYAATIPWNFRLPDDGTLDYIGVMVGNSGSGKSRSKKAAMALMPPELTELDGVRLSMPAPSSGEGMIESFIKRSKGQQVGLSYRGLNFYIDEGQQFFSMLDRGGNTLAEVLKSAWVGEMTGNATATVDRHRVLAPGEVRVSALIGIQIDVAAQFLSAARTNGGLPQRVNWAWAYHPERKPETSTDWPGYLPVAVWDRMKWGGGDGLNRIVTLTLESSVQEELWARQDARADSPDSGLLDAHAEFSIEKTAAVLALMHGQMEVSREFWELACLDWNLTQSIRDEVARRDDVMSRDRDVAIGRSQAARNLATIDVYLERAIESLVKKVSASDTPTLARDVKDHLRSYSKRYGLSYLEVAEAAAARGRVVIHSTGSISRGGS